MAYFNQYGKTNYRRIMFVGLSVGEKFRKDFFKNGKQRTDVVCIKTGELSFMEEWNKKEHTVPGAIFEVSSYT